MLHKLRIALAATILALLVTSVVGRASAQNAVQLFKDFDESMNRAAPQFSLPPAFAGEEGPLGTAPASGGRYGP
jgi:hypothetical protein